VLIGSTWGAETARLERLPNVHLLGERPYDDLPSMAASFDVGIIPFKRTPLIEATDPVKFYEMMALGLGIVAPPIPELAAQGDLLHFAEGAEAFLEVIENMLSAPLDPVLVERRKDFARANTWEQRVDIFEEALKNLFPLVSIGIVTFNNRELTELCLESIARYTVHPNYEIIVVDNASEDDTGRWLTEESARRPGLRVLLNDVNRGFGAACNQAFAEASGEILCFLNNDTVVSRGWLSSMVQILISSREVGLVGPSSNGVANEAYVKPGYTDLDGLQNWAADFVWRHDGVSFSIPMLALYCAALRQEVWEEIGALDERFEIGLFEDDDFSRRIRRAGYDTLCLRNAWVHHFQEASFGKLPQEEYARIYEANRKRFQEKWKGAR
jgi:GT2 family glycosyltransferase